MFLPTKNKENKINTKSVGSHRTELNSGDFLMEKWQMANATASLLLVGSSLFIGGAHITNTFMTFY